MRAAANTYEQVAVIFIGYFDGNVNFIIHMYQKKHNSIKTLAQLGMICLQQIEIEIDHQFNALHDKYCETMRSSIELNNKSLNGKHTKKLIHVFSLLLARSLPLLRSRDVFWFDWISIRYRFWKNIFANWNTDRFFSRTMSLAHLVSKFKYFFSLFFFRCEYSMIRFSITLSSRRALRMRTVS